MAYKLKGNTPELSVIIVVNQDDWTNESTISGSMGDFKCSSLSNSLKTIILRNNLGKVRGYSDVNPIEELGNIQINVQNNDDDTVNPEYSFDNSNWTPIGNILSGNQGSVSIDDQSLGDYTVYFQWVDPDNSQTYNASPQTKSVVDESTTVWDFTITELIFEADRGLFGGGGMPGVNVIDYVDISTPGNATDFGDTYSASAISMYATSNGMNDTGIFAGGNGFNNISSVTISTLSNTSDFGDITSTRGYGASSSNGTNERGIFGGGGSTGSNIIDYITISTPGNAQDFGDLISQPNIRDLGGTSNATNNRGIFAAGFAMNLDAKINNIQYVTISTTGNASDFGDMSAIYAYLSGTSNGTNNRGVFDNCASSSYINKMDYITISTTGNSVDFGDLTVLRYLAGATSNGTSERGVIGGGYYSSTYYNTIDYITISNTGNASDFGDLTVSRAYVAATSNA